MNHKTLLIALLALLTVPGIALGALAITSQPVTTGNVGNQYQYQAQANQTTNLTWTLTQSPGNMNISDNGLVQWVPPNQGNYDVTVQVNNTTTTTQQSYTVAVTGDPAQFEAGTIELGGEDQERDRTGTAQYTIRNIGDEPITNVQVQPQQINSEYQINVSLASTTIQGNSQTTATINYFVPEDLDSGRNRIGSVQISGDSANPIIRDVFLEPENGLRFEEVEVSIDGDDETIDDGDETDEAQIDDEIEVTVTLENILEDTDIEDIEGNLEVDEIDVDIDEDINQIDAGDEEDLTFTFDIDPRDADFEEAPWEAVITIEGEDENGASHNLEFEFRIDVDVDDEDIRILESRVNPSQLRCSQTTFEIESEIRNVGDDDADEAMLRFESNELDIDEFIRDIEIDTGDTEDFSRRFTIDSDTEPGSYIIDVTTYFEQSTSSRTDRDTVSLTVPECDATDDGDDDEDDNSNGNDATNGGNNGGSIVVDQGGNSENVTVPGTPVVVGEGTSASDDTYLYVLGAIICVLIITAGAVIVKLLD